MKKLITPVLLIFTAPLLLLSCLSGSDPEEKEAMASMEFRFKHTAGGVPLVFDSQNYTNSAGNVFTVSGFRYHITDFKIKDDNGDVIDSSTQSLFVDAKTNSNPSFVISQLPAIHFHTVNFTISPVDPVTKSVLTRQDFFVMDISLNFQDSSGGTHALTTQLNGTALAEDNGFVYRSGGLHTMMEAGKTIMLDIELDIMNIFNTPNMINFEKFSSEGILNGDPDSQKMLRDNMQKSAFEIINVSSM